MSATVQARAGAAIRNPQHGDTDRRIYRRHRLAEVGTLNEAAELGQALTLLLLRLEKAGHLCACAACEDVRAYLGSPSVRYGGRA